mgnify:FL=1
MSSGGGGKGGGKKTTTETTVPEWVRAPADRNLQRAEALQQIEYMPYYGAQVAAFNDNQAAAFQNNNDAASAFGLLAPTDAMSSMPTPTTYANGMKGYSSIPLYDQAMKELTASNPDNMDAYSKLFGNAVPANTPQYAGRSGGGGGGGVAPRGGRDLTYAETMAQTYANTKVGEDASGKSIYGYTGQGDAGGRAGVMDIGQKEKYNYNVQATKPTPPAQKKYASQKTYKSKGGNYARKNPFSGGR